MEFGYINFFGIKCTFTQDKLDFYLFPADDSLKVNFYPYRHKENFILQFESDIYKNCCIYVEKINIGLSNQLYLKVKYISKQIPNDGVYMYTLVGDEIDEFFSPLDYFFTKKTNGDYTPTDLLYSTTTIATYNFQLESKKVIVDLIYGNTLSHGIRSDLKIHPQLQVKFETTADTLFIYRTLDTLIRFIQFVRRQKSYNFKRIELFGNIEGRFQHVGFLYESMYDVDQIPHSHCDAPFKFFNTNISALLQIISDETSFPLAHLPQFDYESYNYDAHRFASIFSAFEYECSQNKILYELNSNQNSYTEIKNTILEYITSLSTNDEFEADFQNWAKERIGQLGSQLGQQRKITNAYNNLEAYFTKSIDQIIWRSDSVKATANKLTSSRGKILHNEIGKSLTEDEIECIRFLDILQFVMVLKRANMSITDVEFIIGQTYHCNSTYLESLT